jgi:hypothetical protein
VYAYTYRKPVQQKTGKVAKTTVKTVVKTVEAEVVAVNSKLLPYNSN